MSGVADDEGLWWIVDQLLRERSMYTHELRAALLTRFPEERVPSDDQLEVTLANRQGIEPEERYGPWRAARDPKAPVPPPVSRRWSPRRRPADVRTRRLVRPAVDAWASWLTSQVDDPGHNGLLLGISGGETGRLLALPVKRYGSRTWLAVRPLGPYRLDLAIRMRGAERLGWRHVPAGELADWVPGIPSIPPQPGEPLLQVYTNRQRVVLASVLVHQLQGMGCSGPHDTMVERLAITPAEARRRARLQAVQAAEREAAVVSYRAVVAPRGRQLPVQSYCGACGQPLSDPDSVERGFGPECWERMTGEARRVLARPVGALACAMEWDSAIALTMTLLESGRLAH